MNSSTVVKCSLCKTSLDFLFGFLVTRHVRRKIRMGCVDMYGITLEKWKNTKNVKNVKCEFPRIILLI